jgi:hypothetical protein
MKNSESQKESSQANVPTETPPIPTSKKKQKRLILALSLFMLIILIGTGFLVYRHFQIVLQKSISSQPAPSLGNQAIGEASTLTSLPPLYPLLIWKQTPKPASLSSLPDFILYTDEGDVDIYGEDWDACKSNLNSEELNNLTREFFSYYKNEFEKIGWKTKINVEGTTIRPVFAGGPGSNYWGYIGIKNDKLRVVQFQEDSRSSQTSSRSVCFSVFISEAYSVDDILSSANSSGWTEEDCKELRDEIKNLLDQANNCQKGSDCKVISLGCPFGCHNLVNQNSDTSNISLAGNKYKENCGFCEYRCTIDPKPQEIKCRNNKCIDIRFEK